MKESPELIGIGENQGMILTLNDLIQNKPGQTFTIDDNGNKVQDEPKEIKLNGNFVLVEDIDYQVYKNMINSINKVESVFNSKIENIINDYYSYYSLEEIIQIKQFARELYDVSLTDFFFSMFQRYPTIISEEDLVIMMIQSGNVQLITTMYKFFLEILENENSKKLHSLCFYNFSLSITSAIDLASIYVKLIVKELLEQNKENGNGPSNNKNNQDKNNNNNSNKQGEEKINNESQESKKDNNKNQDKNKQKGQNNKGNNAGKKSSNNNSIDKTLSNININFELSEEKIKNVLQYEYNDINKEINESKENIKEMNEMIRFFGLDDQKIFKPKEVMEILNNDLMKNLSMRLFIRKVLPTIGRIEEISNRTRKTKKKNNYATIDSVTTGNDINSVLTSELSSLNKKTLKKQFYKKYNEKQLLQYEKKSKGFIGKGPLIVCCDVSSSMHSSNKIDYCKALTLVTLNTASKENRNFTCLFFEANINEQITVTNKQQAFYGKKVILSKRPNGGTNFSIPLRKAAQIVGSSKFKKSDILFITDGEDVVDDNTIKKINILKKEKDFTITTLVLSDSRNNKNQLQHVASFSDKLFSVRINLSMLETNNISNELKEFEENFFNSI